MKTADLIGQIIKDIFVWCKMEVGGLDNAEVFILLHSGVTVSIPWDFDSENIECSIRKGAVSLFSNLDDYLVYNVNQEGKTIGEVQELKRKREVSLIGRLKSIFGIEEGMPNEYKVYKTVYRGNNLKYLKNQKIVDFIIFNDFDLGRFIELENGYLITETLVSPHGTGLVGLNFYESLREVESKIGIDYKRIKNKSY